MGHEEKWTECNVCGERMTYNGVNNYLDPGTGKISSLCDEHLKQVMAIDRKEGKA